MSTTTLSDIITRLSQKVGDYVSEAVTTALTTSTDVVCTSLANYFSHNNIYKPAWIYVTDKANAGAYRRVSSYTSSTIVVLGANFSSDGANLATFEIHKYDRRNKIRAINLAARKSWPNMFRILRDTTLSSNNIAPNPSFEDWASSSYPDYWTTLSNATAAESTTAGTVRGISGSSSLKLTASAGNGYIELNSDVYPKLLDFMNHQGSVYVWCNPQTANDGSIIIYTKQADATTQTLTSTTTNPAGEFTLLELENQQLNNNVVEVRIRLNVATSGQYAYFDNFRLNGMSVSEYLLPLDFQNPLTAIDSVSYGVGASQYYPNDDMLAKLIFNPLYGWSITDDSTSKYISLPFMGDDTLIQIKGRAPLESDLSAATSTMTIEDPHLDLLIELAASELFNIESGLPSAGDRDFLKSKSYEYLASYEYMKKSLKMRKPQAQQRIDRRILR